MKTKGTICLGAMFVLFVFMASVVSNTALAADAVNPGQVPQPQAPQQTAGAPAGGPGEAPDLSIAKVQAVPYTAGSRRDPFVSIISYEKEKSALKKKSKNPLENFDVSDFKLLGVIFDGRQYYASVVLPDQKSYTILKGMKVGLYGGRIEDITQESLTVKEFVTDFMGNLKPKYTEIKLRKKEER